MKSFDSHSQERRSVTAMDGTFKHYSYKLAPALLPFITSNPNKTLHPTFSYGFDDDIISAVVPPVTVVLEGRSICQRISLHKHGSYHSLAMALRQMFVVTAAGDQFTSCDDSVVDLSNAVPGYVIAYEDMENDLLLVGDLNWKDFVKVAKRIRVLPAKAKSRKQKKELN